jgi:gamma-glutamylcyclotransferase (GGCT)/AIG2-like uncharacterized protein YtfP
VHDEAPRERRFFVSCFRGNQTREESQMRYFAYCTLLDVQEMRRFCPDARPTVTGTVAGWRVGFAAHSADGGGCQLVPAPGATIHGLLYDMPGDTLTQLDTISGVPAGLYSRIDVEVTTADGVVPAVTYIIPAPFGPFTPSPAYVRPILEGARALNLPADYIASLEAAVRDA